MGASVKPSPQVKVTCKRTSKKLNIEALDKNTINEIKKVTDIYILVIERVADYDGEIDEHGYADATAYHTWKENHHNIISKTSINNILRCAKNMSRMYWGFKVYHGTCIPIYMRDNKFRIDAWSIVGDFGIEIGKIVLSNLPRLLRYDKDVYFDISVKHIE